MAFQKVVQYLNRPSPYSLILRLTSPAGLQNPKHSTGTFLVLQHFSSCDRSVGWKKQIYVCYIPIKEINGHLILISSSIYLYLLLLLCLVIGLSVLLVFFASSLYLYLEKPVPPLQTKMNKRLFSLSYQVQKYDFP